MINRPSRDGDSDTVQSLWQLHLFKDKLKVSIRSLMLHHKVGEQNVNLRLIQSPGFCRKVRWRSASFGGDHEFPSNHSQRKPSSRPAGVSSPQPYQSISSMASLKELGSSWTTDSKLSTTPAPPKRLTFPDPSTLSTIEKAKRLAAHAAVIDHFPRPAKVVGIGSGSTIIYAVEKILELKDIDNVIFVPTGFQSKELIVQGGLRLGAISEYFNPLIDVDLDILSSTLRLTARMKWIQIYSA